MRQLDRAGTGLGPTPGRHSRWASATPCTSSCRWHEDGPGNGTWNFNRYTLPRGSDVAVWTQTGKVLPALSDTDPPKGMAEVVMIPMVRRDRERAHPRHQHAVLRAAADRRPKILAALDARTRPGANATKTRPLKFTVNGPRARPARHRPKG